MNKTDVVIAARNEERTIAPIVYLFKHHRKIGQVIVSLDADTDDDTILAAGAMNARCLLTGRRGKGQVASLGLELVQTRDVIFCDADYTGLTKRHIDKMLFPPIECMRVGVPDLPANLPAGQVWAWPFVSGFRRLPTWLAREPNLTGYLMEVQLNRAARDARLPVSHTALRGLMSSYDMTGRRVVERDRDLAYGRRMGIIP